VAGGFDGVTERADKDLVLWERGVGLDVLGESFACYGRDAAIQKAGCDEEFHDGWHAADVEEVGCHVST
jgi:hypothetical protein